MVQMDQLIYNKIDIIYQSLDLNSITWQILRRQYLISLDGNANLFKNIPHKNRHVQWFFVYFGFSRPQQKAKAYIRWTQSEVIEPQLVSNLKIHSSFLHMIRMIYPLISRSKKINENGKGFAYALYLNREDSFQFNRLKNFVRNQFWFYLGADGFNQPFEGTLFNLNLHIGDGSFYIKPKYQIVLWPQEPKQPRIELMRSIPQSGGVEKAPGPASGQFEVGTGPKLGQVSQADGPKFGQIDSANKPKSGQVDKLDEAKSGEPQPGSKPQSGDSVVNK